MQNVKIEFELSHPWLRAEKQPLTAPSSNSQGPTKTSGQPVAWQFGHHRKERRASKNRDFKANLVT